MKKMNDKKICFIFCTNNQQYASECLLYLSLLQVPEGYETEVLAIEDAASITAGYNEGMRASDAKYKVYMHHDTFITEPQFIQKLLDVFGQDEKIGIIGVIGAEKLSKDGVMWHEERCGDFYRLDHMIKDGLTGIERIKDGIREVEVVDGLLIATQYDIPWREDVFKGWDFYDVSQCMEFRRAGYRIVVPAQRPAWVNHACGAPSFWQYEENRKLALQEYPEIWQGSTRLRILFIHSKNIKLMGLAYSLTNMGHNVNIPDYQVSLVFSERDVKSVEDLLEEGHYDLVMTYDFSMGVAKACDNRKVKYYSWVYDSPLFEIYSDYAKSPYIYISVFDRKQYHRMKEFGLVNIYHLPLCAEVDVFGSINITKQDEKKYAADVSFVGRLYDSRGYQRLFDEQSASLKEEFDSIVAECDCHWDGKVNVHDKASEELIQHIVKQISDNFWKLYYMGKRFYAETINLAGRCNELERITILNKLAERHKVTLYSDDTPKNMLHNVRIEPWVDYWNEMPKVFHLSKINLNITSRSIESGVPQRVWDIMAVGGFCLTNYQEELADYFVEGRDLEVFRDVDELMDKVAYYLKHEDKRIRIAMSGYQKVKESHSYYHRLEKILPYIFPEPQNTWV